MQYSIFKLGVLDGGPESPVTFYGIEIKWLGSIGFIKFSKGQREAFHNHAFNALTWFLKGVLIEERLWAVSQTNSRSSFTNYARSLLPKFTSRKNMHRVRAKEDSWCFTIRGPWQNIWREYNPQTGLFTVFTHGREILGTYSAIT